MEKSEWKQERQSLLDQLKLVFRSQFANRSEALKLYDESQGELFNEVECEAANEEEVEVTPAVLKVLEYVRPKYVCRQCEATQADEAPLNLFKADKQC